jgi:diaminohydroxyphosphoribosylaminopyrimidine deaminase/5-amino-6-(5-phosphoribosylamino)uracil reductase
MLLPAPRVSRPFQRIVLDPGLRIPRRSRLVLSARRWPVWVVCGSRAAASRRAALEARGVTVIPIAGRARRPALALVLAELKRRGIWSLMVEGGAEVLGSFVHARLFDELALFRAPLILGGRRALPAFAGPDPRRLSDAVRLRPAGPAPDRPFELWYPAAAR